MITINYFLSLKWSVLSVFDTTIHLSLHCFSMESILYEKIYFVSNFKTATRLVVNSILEKQVTDLNGSRNTRKYSVWMFSLW